ncbi:MAG: hypothetical protein HYX27_26370 [Acidobacteria bacterium]|nr:hypothetical protein [Acidobacteriota bacterium]
MIPERRRQFLEQWTAEKYHRLLRVLEERSRTIIPFRVCETPCFLPAALTRALITAGGELIRQLQEPAYRQASEAAIPAQFRAPNEAARPLFVQVDFGLVRDVDGNVSPKLVEMQGFPSLYAFQSVLTDTYCEVYGLHHAAFPDYRHMLRKAILGGHAPENVVLLEIDPRHQKTLCDFQITEDWFGVRAVCMTQVRKRGNRLFYERDGIEVPIRRIYNRAITDEQVRRKIQPGFAWSDDLDVEWAGHPNYYFRISKFSLPYLRHPSVPETRFLNSFAGWPDDLEEWVLKPLYSFAGIGVNVGPARAALDAIPAAERASWILQRRCRFAPVIETPSGPTQAEIRVMYIWLDELHAVATLMRMGRGKMMGVDHNKNMDWVGASAGLWIPD